MAADLRLLSLAQRQNLYQQQQKLQKQGVWNWTGARQTADETIPWAAAVDTGGAAWPPRSYSCTFCRREFRSAQALGGHMNVHRRDRARLHQSSSPGPEAECSLPVAAAAQLSSSIVFSSQTETSAGGGGLCLFYPIPTLANGVAQAAGNTLLNLLPGMAGSIRSAGDERSGKHGIRDQNGDDDMITDDLDLELRLGW